MYSSFLRQPKRDAIVILPFLNAMTCFFLIELLSPKTVQVNFEKLYNFLTAAFICWTSLQIPYKFKLKQKSINIKMLLLLK